MFTHEVEFSGFASLLFANLFLPGFRVALLEVMRQISAQAVLPTKGRQVAIDPKIVMSFTVEAKIVKYIGALKLYSKSGQNAFGIPLSVPGYLEVDANESRDISEALKKCDSRKPTDKPVKVDFLTVQNAAQHPFVVVKQREPLKP